MSDNSNDSNSGLMKILIVLTAIVALVTGVLTCTKEGIIVQREIFGPKDNANKVSPSKPVLPDQDKITSFTANIGGIKYKLNLAEFQGNRLIVLFRAFNSGAETVRSLAYGSYMLDQNSVNHQQAVRTNGSEVGGMDFYEVELPHDTESTLGLVFDDVNPSDTLIKYVRIDFKESPPLEMKNVPIPFKPK